MLCHCGTGFVYLRNLQNVLRSFQIEHAQFANFRPKPEHNPNFNVNPNLDSDPNPHETNMMMMFQLITEQRRDSPSWLCQMQSWDSRDWVPWVASLDGPVHYQSHQKTTAHDGMPAAWIAGMRRTVFGLDYRQLRLSNTWHDSTVAKAQKLYLQTSYNRNADEVWNWKTNNNTFRNALLWYVIA